MSNQFFNIIGEVQDDNFHRKALDVFAFQAQNNLVYKQWIQHLGIDIHSVKTITDIPFLPVSFFKTHPIVTGVFEPVMVFESSSTTGLDTSKHYIRDIELYRKSFLAGFKQFYGSPSDWCIIGLLPSYLERKGSSLVLMMDELIQLSGHKNSGFYLHNFQKLADTISMLESQKQKTILVGVTFALLDFAEQFPMKLEYTTVMETGGMKGRRKEMIRAEVHNFLQTQFQLPTIHSEYGMTELLSQAYSKADGIFYNVPWMKILVRDEDDPLNVKMEGKGLINIIDLANLHSCSFIATDDVGKVYDDGSFEVLGRMDNSDIRGCSLMVVG